MLLNRKRQGTTWKVSKYGVFSGPHFPVFGLNTGIYGVNLRFSVRIQENTDQTKHRIWTLFTQCLAFFIEKHGINLWRSENMKEWQKQFGDLTIKDIGNCSCWLYFWKKHWILVIQNSITKTSLKNQQHNLVSSLWKLKIS